MLPHSLVSTYSLLNCSKSGVGKFYEACERGDIETVRKWIPAVSVKNYQVIPVEISTLILIYTSYGATSHAIVILSTDQIFVLAMQPHRKIRF